MHLTCQDVTYKDGLRHEGEVLGAPQVAVVDRGHKDVSEEDTDVLVNLEPDRIVETRRANEIPVETPGQESHALVVTCTAENIAEHGTRVICEAENRDSCQKRENPWQ